MSDSSHKDPIDTKLGEPRVDLSTRRHQMFPVLTDAEIARICRFGTRAALRARRRACSRPASPARACSWC